MMSRCVEGMQQIELFDRVVEGNGEAIVHNCNYCEEFVCLKACRDFSKVMRHRELWVCVNEIGHEWVIQITCICQ